MKYFPKIGYSRKLFFNEFNTILNVVNDKIILKYVFFQTNGYENPTYKYFEATVA